MWHVVYGVRLYDCHSSHVYEYLGVAGGVRVLALGGPQPYVYFRNLVCTRRYVANARIMARMRKLENSSQLRTHDTAGRKTSSLSKI